ncbi:MAG TPA: hypothetical protein VK731_04240 [Candidatus Cybelea sp.]|nr:hypothetical protein [Candidatus Cybelea sp.]
MRRINAFDSLEPWVQADRREADYALNIAGVYQDSVTREWGLQNCRRATQLAGEERVQNTWYDVHSLSDPGILLKAVRAALEADVIVVSLYAADELPLDLYVWVQVWLPRRFWRAGILTALIGVAESPDAQSDRTLQYLQAVASKAQLDFVTEKRKRPFATAAAATQQIYGHHFKV